ncbi:hypothetical protein GH810_14290 [Acetobacterium paludosum]|uniref:Uncharacterized protein n=1 Tax=Acetobacterium paludosum TaxID=52693 RepID=A0A923I0K6_9FIRM|nr:hypothetical protein [Acetobacterium paludosum]MBC3889481.1 hypothetical protein [Acetobacterium paludosum]
MKIDCSITENYLKENGRRYKNTDVRMRLAQFTSKDNINSSISDLQGWSDAHPRKTYLEDLLEKYPSIKLSDYGVPKFCPSVLGYQKEVCPFGRCNAEVSTKCWNQIMEDES